jgi:hypothetical protein
MLKNLLLVTLLALSGCIWAVEPSPSGGGRHGSDTYTESHGGLDGDVWIDDYYVECEYDSYWNESRWYIEIIVASTYSYYPDELEVGFYIDTWDWFWTEHSFYGEWHRVFESGYYHCYSSYTFDFVVTTNYGDSDSMTLWW